MRASRAVRSADISTGSVLTLETGSLYSLGPSASFDLPRSSTCSCMPTASACAQTARLPWPANAIWPSSLSSAKITPTFVPSAIPQDLPRRLHRRVPRVLLSCRSSPRAPCLARCGRSCGTFHPRTRLSHENMSPLLFPTFNQATLVWNSRRNWRDLIEERLTTHFLPGETFRYRAPSRPETVWPPFAAPHSRAQRTPLREGSRPLVSSR